MTKYQLTKLDGLIDRMVTKFSRWELERKMRQCAELDAEVKALPATTTSNLLAFDREQAAKRKSFQYGQDIKASEKRRELIQLQHDIEVLKAGIGECT